jgi:hypothetical protein
MRRNYFELVAFVMIVALILNSGCFETEKERDSVQTVQPQTVSIPPTPIIIETISRYQIPKTGSIIAGSRLIGGGKGEIKIDNTGGGTDTVAVLTNTGGNSPVIAVYIEKGDLYIITGIGDGKYDLYFTGGEEWNPHENVFVKNRIYQRFAEPFEFKTYTTRDFFSSDEMVHYQSFEVTLYTIYGGNAQTEDISGQEFPSL